MSIGFTQQERGVVMFLALTLAAGVAVRGYRAFFAASGPSADEQSVEVAAFERRAAQVAVGQPAPGKRGVRSSTVAETPVPSRRVDVNVADERALEAVPGIGPSLAGRIVAYRRLHGPFSSVGELRKVKGIGPVKLKKMMPSIAPIARK